MDIRRMRVFLNLRQSDVSAATGISVSRLSAAENRRIKLRPAEESALREFLEVRARIVAESESERES
jgi:DNA-binding transcriptional regulator YiaG